MTISKPTNRGTRKPFHGGIPFALVVLLASTAFHDNMAEANMWRRWYGTYNEEPSYGGGGAGGYPSQTTRLGGGYGGYYAGDRGGVSPPYRGTRYGMHEPPPPEACCETKIKTDLCFSDPLVFPIGPCDERKNTNSKCCITGRNWDEIGCVADADCVTDCSGVECLHPCCAVRSGNIKDVCLPKADPCDAFVQFPDENACPGNDKCCRVNNGISCREDCDIDCSSVKCPLED